MDVSVMEIVIIILKIITAIFIVIVGIIVLSYIFKLLGKVLYYIAIPFVWWVEKFDKVKNEKTFLGFVKLMLLIIISSVVIFPLIIFFGVVVKDGLLKNWIESIVPAL
jgi:hypothetical protein